MKIIFGGDHAAFDEKAALISYVSNKYKFEIDDVGPSSNDRCNYPDFAIKLVHKLLKEEEGSALGILICGSGVGMSMVANRFKGIRAALCRTSEDAKLSKEHNNANVLCLGGRVNSNSEIEKIVDEWFASEFTGGRHKERVDLFNRKIGEDVESTNEKI